MSIDFSKLDNLRNDGAKPLKSEFKGSSSDGGINTSETKESAQISSFEADKKESERVVIPPNLQREQNALKMARKLAAVYQDATKRTQQAQFDLLKGVRNHEDLKTLFLLAVKGFSAAVCNDLLYEQIEEEIEKYY